MAQQCLRGLTIPQKLERVHTLNTHTHTHTATGSDNDDDFYWQEAHAACMPIAVCRLRIASNRLHFVNLFAVEGKGGVRAGAAGAKSLAIIVIIDAVKYVCSHYLGTVCPRDAIVQMEH